MSHRVRFSLTDGERASFRAYAEARGMTLSGMAKIALFRYAEAERNRERYNAERRTWRPEGRPRIRTQDSVKDSKQPRTRGFPANLRGAP